VGRRKKCMICRSTDLEKFVDLGRQPNGNAFPDGESLSNEVFYELSMSVCRKCWLVQLDDCPSPEELFTDHPYVTGLNVPVVRHFANLARHIVAKFELPHHSLVVDIGANDGTLLSEFRKLGMRILGVDPGRRTGALAEKAGVTVCRTFWDRDSAAALRRLNVRPRLITATAVFYHVPDLHTFVDGLAEVMDDETIFATQCVYLKNVIEEVQFDHFYHEHTCLYSLRPLIELFKGHGLRVIDVEFYPVHGGSFVAYVVKDGSRIRESESVRAALTREEAAGVFERKTYTRFARRVADNKRQLTRLLRELRKEGATVYALGAPVKGSTLLNYCQIGPDLVSAAVEVNPFKIGRFTPGTHIPVISEAQVVREPDYYIVLAWNFLEYFLQSHDEYLRKGGRFIVPNPTVQIVDHRGAREYR